MNSRTHIVAFITGHSVRGCTGLSREQIDFQQRSQVAQEHWVPHNFPFQETFAFPESVGLLRASLNNVRHFVESMLPAFQRRHRAQVIKLFAAHEAVILLAGSCGVQLLHQLDLPAEILRRVHVFAYGPVSFQRPSTASLFVVQGKNDLLSRCFYPAANHRLVCSHMDYLRAPETLALFHSFYRRVLHDRGLSS